jgi:hypothetical protein
VGDPVGRAHERELAQARLLELLADACEGPPRIEPLREHVEQRGTLLERIHQAAVGADLLGAHLVEQSGGATDEQAPVVVGRLLERAADHEQERALTRAETRLLECELHSARTDPRAGKPLVHVVGRPGHEPRFDGLGKREAEVRDTAGRRDHDHHHDVGLEQQHLCMAHRCRLERRRRDEREQPRHLRQHLSGRLERLLDLRPRDRQPELEPRRARFGEQKELVDVDPVAGLGRHASGRRVRMREQGEALELRELVPDGRGREADARPLDERLGAHRLPGLDVLLDDEAEDVALALGEENGHALHGRRRPSRSGVRRAGAPSGRRRRSGRDASG